MLTFQAANADERTASYIQKDMLVNNGISVNAPGRDSIEITEITDPAISAALQSTFHNLQIDWSALASSLGLRSIGEDDIDFANLKKATVANESLRTPGIAYVAYFRFFDAQSTTNYAFAMYASANGLVKPTIVKVESGQVKYFFLEEDVVVKFANVRNVVQVSNSLGGFNAADRTAGGCGQAVANCVSDVYANHGWLSVWAVVQSSFIPATAVAFTVACTAKNCFD